MLEPAQYVVMRLPYFELVRKWFTRFLTHVVPVLVLVLAVFFSYCVGYLDGAFRLVVPVAVVSFRGEQGDLGTSPEGLQGVVASKSGTTFYYPWCSGRNRIKPENERWFEGPEEALKYGLKPAKNCLGL